MTAALVARGVPDPTAQLAAELGVLAFKRGYAQWSEGDRDDTTGLAEHALAALDDLRTATPGSRSGCRRGVPLGAGPATQGQAKSNRPARPGMLPGTSRTPRPLARYRPSSAQRGCPGAISIMPPAPSRPSPPGR
jgi:hypothetical protein